MAPRRKAAPKNEPQVLSAEGPIAPVNPALAALLEKKPVELIVEYRKLEEWVETQNKAYAEHMKPHGEQLNLIKQALHSMLLAAKANSFGTDEGTAYISTIVQHKVDPAGAPYTSQDGRESVGREALLDWALDNWDKYGNEGLQINVAKAIIDQYMQDTQTEDHPNGLVPPGLTLSSFQRVNIRKS